MNVQQQLFRLSPIVVTLFFASGSAAAAPLASGALNSSAAPTPDICPGGAGCTIKCNTAGVGPSGPLVTQAYEKSRMFLGSSPAEIQQKFAVIQEMNFSQGDAKLIVSRLSTMELAGIAYYYNISAPAGENDLLRIFAEKLDASSLVRIAKAFGSVATRSAVNEYSTPKIKEAFAQELTMNLDIPQSPATAAIAAAPMTGSVVLAAQSLQQAEESIDEVYLEYRTAAVGSTSVRAGLVEAGMYDALGAVSLGWWIGHDVMGPAANWLIDKYDPSLGEAIGGTVYTALEDISDAKTEFEQGDYESAWDDLFGYPLSDLGDYSGDWNIGASYNFYEESTGC